MSILSRFRVWLADVLYDASEYLDPIVDEPEPPPAPPAPVQMLDVAIVMIENPAAKTDLISCVMALPEFVRLVRDWKAAVQNARMAPAAGCYLITVNGQKIEQGLMLTDIASLTGAYSPLEGVE